MNLRAKLRVLGGVLIVAAIATSLMIYLEAAQSALPSDEAEIVAESYAVGTDYTGLVTKQFVQEGDNISAGQTMFQVKSSTLLEQIQEGNLERSKLIYPLSDDGDILLQAPKDGTIAEIYYSHGSFVPANKEIATIIDNTSVKVIATFRLSRKDFARLSKEKRLEVRLPSGEYTSSNVSAITVIEQSDRVETEIEAKLDQLRSSQLDLTSGTPVNTRLYLKEKTIWSRIKARVVDIF